MVSSCSACVTAIKYHSVSNLLDFFQCTYIVLYEEIFLLCPYLECTVCCHLIFLELIKCLRMCSLNALIEDILDILRYNGAMEWSQIIWSGNLVFCMLFSVVATFSLSYQKLRGDLRSAAALRATLASYPGRKNEASARHTQGARDPSAPFCRMPAFSLAAMMLLSDSQSP